MAVVENAGVDLAVTVDSSSNRASSDTSSPPDTTVTIYDQDQIKHNNNHSNGGSVRIKSSLQYQNNNNGPILRAHDQSAFIKVQRQQLQQQERGTMDLVQHGRTRNGGDLQRDLRDLAEFFSKLNPMAEEFVPPSLGIGNNHGLIFNGGFYATNNSNVQNNFINGQANSFINGHANNFINGHANGFSGRRKNGYSQGRRRMNSRTSMAQREEIIKRTIYVSDIDHQVTEEQLAGLFVDCGQVVDCRICGDPNSVLRFAFVEFTDEEGAGAALSLAGTMLGYYPVRVLPSKTAIAPVNPTFLPMTEVEREMCARTIYCTNIDKKVSQADVKFFFESVCGEVMRLRLLGDYHHSTRIAFVEFFMAESAIAALNCSGVVLGSLPIRVSPSKTPVRPRSPRIAMH